MGNTVIESLSVLWIGRAVRDKAPGNAGQITGLCLAPQKRNGSASYSTVRFGARALRSLDFGNKGKDSAATH